MPEAKVPAGSAFHFVDEGSVPIWFALLRTGSQPILRFSLGFVGQQPPPLVGGEGAFPEFKAEVGGRLDLAQACGGTRPGVLSC